MGPTRAFLLLIILAMLGDFVVRGIATSLSAGKNDLSDPFVGAWLWRHGSNPYDAALATETGELLTGSQTPLVPIYPPTTFLLVAPLTFLPWGWANVAVALMGILGVCLTAFCVTRIGHFGIQDETAWFTAAFVFAFAPFHTSLHVANIAAISTALYLFAIYLATCDRELEAGFALAVATCLKPHLGIWIFVYYAVRMRWRLFFAGALSVALVGVISLAKIGVPAGVLLADYTANLGHWFGPGGENDFSLANPLRYQLASSQLVLQPWVGTSSANVCAFCLVAVAVGLWIYAVHRNSRCPEALALSSLLTLSFLAVYHRVYDTSILTLSLAWILSDADKRLKLVKRLALVLLTLLLLPIQSAVQRSQLYLPFQATHSWWWNLAVAPSISWVLLAFSAVLLYAVPASGRTASSASAADDVAN
jgi:hypothetical protein